MMRDCVWDVTMETQSLPTRILAVHRADFPVPKEGSAGILLDSLRKVLARVPPGRQVSQVTLLGFTLVPSEKEHTVFDDIFDTLLQCSTISFRKCSCQASTLLHLLQAIRRALCHKAYSWIGLWVMPSCPARSESPELAAAFRVEMPRFLYALRKSKLHTCSEQALFDLSISANLISFNAVISSCEREGRWREALHLLNEVKGAQPLPDCVTYSAGISACANASRWAEAIALLCEALEGLGMPEPQHAEDEAAVLCTTAVASFSMTSSILSACAPLPRCRLRALPAPFLKQSLWLSHGANAIGLSSAINACEGAKVFNALPPLLMVLEDLYRPRKAWKAFEK
eukprot:g14845.t1